MTAAALAASALPPLAGAPAVGLASAATVAHDKLPFSHPERQPMRFDLPKAVRHFLRFRKDKEQTSEVFHLFEALPWTGVVDAARAFLATERGQAIYAAEPFLPDLLDDHDALRRMPPGSLAHEYCDYMETEGLSAAGLVHEYDVFRGDRPRLDDQVEWYIDRLRDTHDLLHILTGFGRDTLGEQCLATFVFRQRPSMGHFVLGYAGALVIRTQVKTRAPVLRAAREAQVIGQSCPRICEESILELLAMTTAQVRRKLNLREPRHYRECHRIWREEGIDPQQVLAKG
jgi:ubiquinone biosynthesis protein COQ4